MSLRPQIEHTCVSGRSHSICSHGQHSPRVVCTQDIAIKYTSSKQLRTCLSVRAKSTSTTPTVEFAPNSSEENTGKMLRRVKTVGFQDSPKLLCVSPESEDDFDNDTRKELCISGEQIPRDDSRAPSYFSIVKSGKSSPADPAVTLADVHAVVLVPMTAHDDAEDNTHDTYAMRTKTFNSTTGTNKDTEDDTTTRQDIRVQEQLSSTCQGLRSSDTSNAVYGLQQVNYKLVDWSDVRPDITTPAIPRIEICAGEEDFHPGRRSVQMSSDDFTFFAPPNSHKTSAATSRPASRPASAPITREPSHETIKLKTLWRGFFDDEAYRKVSTGDEILVSDYEDRAAQYTADNKRLRLSNEVSQLPNMEEIDLNFRGHRDSVTLARSRLYHNKSSSPEMLDHRDSILMAKKRMHARNHFASAVNDVSREKRTNVSLP